MPNRDGLHVFEYIKYFGVDKSGFMFSKTTVNNKTKNRLAMFHNMTSKFSTYGAIATVKKSKGKF